MPKPTKCDLHAAIVSNYNPWTSADIILRMVEEWEAEDAAERERGRKALDILECWFVSHTDACANGFGGACNCGLGEALAALAGHSAAASWEDVTASFEDEDIEQFNAAQRLRREGYFLGARECSQKARTDTSIREFAGRRYPLKKRVAKVIPDPLLDRVAWRLRKDGKAFEAGRDGDEPTAEYGEGFTFTPARVLALAELLKEPWTIEEDTNPVETT
jgi:hypothetical protein